MTHNFASGCDCPGCVLRLSQVDAWVAAEHLRVEGEIAAVELLVDEAESAADEAGLQGDGRDAFIAKFVRDRR